MKDSILTINAGSSSIKLALYKTGETKPCWNKNIEGNDPGTIMEELNFDSIKAIGHRIVYGMHNNQPLQITTALIKDLKEISSFDPEHMPAEITLIEAFAKHRPDIPQVACFDTAFHANMPDIAKILPLPAEYGNKGIKRYGFHGLSYAYLLEELGTDAGNKTILAHLGNGASLAAVKEGKSVDTTMGFTPTSGLPMGTRTGDLDPGVAWYLMQKEHITPEKYNHLINHESGLLGISGVSSDMRELTKSDEPAAKEAIEFFCYQTRKWIGAFATVLGGLDTLVFSGGIGEHSPLVREKICENLSFLGIEINKTNNEQNNRIIGEGKVKVYVIPTNEELMIAKTVCQVLNF